MLRTAEVHRSFSEPPSSLEERFIFFSPSEADMNIFYVGNVENLQFAYELAIILKGERISKRG